MGGNGFESGLAGARERILFVDDEPRILEGLTRLLRPMRDKFDVSVANGSDEALKVLASRPFDVVVSDMRMPGMDGAGLLGRVQVEHPEVVRIVLSGQTDLQTALRTVPIAHQFLTKPCDVNSLLETLDRARHVHRVQHNPRLHEIVGGVKTLPSLPSVCAELADALGRDDIAIADVAKIIAKDVGIATKLLQLVCSPFFGARRRPSTVHDAVAYLGVNVVRNVVLSLGALSAFEQDMKNSRFDHAEFQAHSLKVASLARRIAARADADQAFTAGLLHDVGTLVLAARTPHDLKKTTELARETDRTLREVEMETLGYTHAEAGGMLTALWGFAWQTVEAVAHHADARDVPHAGFELMDSVHVACTLLDRDDCRRGPDFDAYLERFNVLDQLPAWDAAASEISSAEEAA